MLRASTTRAAEGGGTAPYMAPEQHDSESFGRVSAKTDVWAFGCIVLEMLTGEVPWAGMRPMEIMMNVAVKKKAPSIPHGLPEALLATLRGCFVHDQAGRFSSDDAILALEPLSPASRSGQTASGEGGDAAESRAVQMMQARLAEFEQRFATQEAVNKQLHAQVAALTQQLADHSVQTQRQIADTQKQTQRQIADTQKQVTEASSQADVKLGHLSRQLQEETLRQIQLHAGKSDNGLTGRSPALAAWMKEVEQELQKQQQQPQPEPEAARIVPKVAARSAAVAAGGTDPLTAAMEQQGLTAADQAVLVKGGVTTLDRFAMLTDDDYTTSRIDIAARRSAKAAADQAFADAQGVRDLLHSEGRDISAAGADAIIRGAGTMTKLCAMDLAAMKSLGLSIMDARFLANLMASSPTVARFRLRAQCPQLAGVSEAGWDALAAASATSLEALAALGANKQQKARLLKSLARADAQLVEPLMTLSDRWVKAHKAVDIRGENGALATAGQDASSKYRPAVCGRVLQASGAAYAEFTWVAGGDVMVGVARAGFDPAQPIQGQWEGLFTTAAGWMMQSSGSFYHNSASAAETPWASGTKEGIAVGQTVGLLLRKGNLSVYIKGACVGTLCTGLSGSFVWATDLYNKASVRIALKPPPS